MSLLCLASASGDVALFFGAVAVLGIAVGAITYPHNKKIAFGVGWKPSSAITASVLMGINSALCCGIIGYVVMQNIASKEMKKYGLQGGLFGLKKRDFDAVLANRRAATYVPMNPPSPQPPA